MRTFMRSLAVIVAVVLLAPVTAVTQRGREGGARGSTPASPPHDPHDLTGIWMDRAVGTIYKAERSFTPAGKAAFDANKPGFGPRAVPPAVGNDPLGDANPPGLP